MGTGEGRGSKVERAEKKREDETRDLFPIFGIVRDQMQKCPIFTPE